MAKRIFGVDIDFQSQQALNMVLHSITGSGDFHSTVGGAIGFMSPNGDKRIAFWDDQISALVKVPRLDRAEAVTGQWSFSPGSTQAPFALGANALGQLVTGLNADKLDGFDSAQGLVVSTVAVRDASGRMKAADPSANDDVATKGYTDAVAAGLNTRIACRVATAAALPSNSRSSNTLTASANGSINGTGIDGLTNLAVNDRVLVKNEATQANNGIYTITAVGDGSNPWTMVRATDADESSELHKAYVAITEGTANGGSGWTQTTSNPTVNTSAIVWNLFNPPVSITQGNGIVKVGSAIHVGQSSAYTQGGLFYAQSSNTMGPTGALTGIVQGNGSAAPTAITGTAGYIPRWSASAPYLQGTSMIYDDTARVVIGGTSVRTVYDGGGGTASNPVLGVRQTSGVCAISAYVQDGTNNRSIAFGINQTAGTAFITTVATAGNPDLVFEMAGTECWRITSVGVLQGAGARTIQSSGALSINTTASNGNISLTPNGSGATYVYAVSSYALNVIRTSLDNQGTAGVLNIQSDAKTVNDAVNVIFQMQDSASATVPYASIAAMIESPTAGAISGKLQFRTYSGGSSGVRWSVLGTGVLESNGAQTIRSSTGNLTLATGAANGNILLTPHGSGAMLLTTATTYPFRIDGSGTDAQLRLTRPTTNTADWSIGVSGNELRFYDNVAAAYRWTISSTGEWVATGAQTIRTTTGNLTLATAAGNGNLLLTPNGTGVVWVTKATTSSPAAEEGLIVDSTTTATSNTLHKCSPYFSLRANIWAAGASVGKRVLMQTVGVSGTDGAYSLVVASSDLASMFQIRGDTGNAGFGTTNPQGALDMGAGTTGRAIVWGGSSGTVHNASIGMTYSSASLVVARGLKLSGSVADQVEESYTGTLSANLIRLNSSGDTEIYGSASASRTAGTVFSIGTTNRIVLFQASDKLTRLYGNLHLTTNASQDVVANTPSGALGVGIGRINSLPNNHTCGFVGFSDSGLALAGDLLLMPRSSTGVNSAIRFYTGQTTPVERLTIAHTGLVSLPGLTPSQLVLTDASRNLVSAATLSESLGGTGRSVFTYAANIGNGSATSFTLTHNLGSRDVVVTVYRNASPYDEIIVDVEHTDANTVTVKFNVAPTTNEYRVAIK